MADSDPEALERQIERTRAELARTVDAIADRVSPKRVARRGVAKMRATAEHAAASLGDLLAGAAPAVGAREDGEKEEATPNVAPLLIGIGVVVVVGAVVVMLRRRDRRRR